MIRILDYYVRINIVITCFYPEHDTAPRYLLDILPPLVTQVTNFKHRNNEEYNTII